MRILIAEDDYVSRLVLQKTLEGLGHECLVAEDGMEAWEAYRRDPDVEVVISDWMMPNMDGIELCRRMRGISRAGHPFFIMLTALGGRDRLLEGLSAGVDEYLVKPLNRDQLRARLQFAAKEATLHRHLDREASPEAGRISAETTQAEKAPTAEQQTDLGQNAEAESSRVWGILVSQGKLNEEQLNQALEAQKSDPREIGEILVSLGTISRVDLARVRAQRLGLSYVEIDVRDIDARAVDLLPEQAVRRYGVVPLRLEGERLFVATSDPTDVDALDHLASLSGRAVIPVVASAEDIREAQTRLFVSEQSSKVLEQASDALGARRQDELL